MLFNRRRNRWFAKRTMKLRLMTLLVFGATALFGQIPNRPDNEVSRSRAVSGATLNHFGRVDEGVYKGSKPKSDADFQFLQSLHVKYIVDLHILPWVDSPERRRAERYGITVITAQMNASPMAPSEKHVETILATLRDSECHPVYFHCTLGRDRTSVIAALYKMYFLGMTPDRTVQYLYESGYKDGWVRSGLRRYLARHSTPPPGLMSATSTSGHCSSQAR